MYCQFLISSNWSWFIICQKKPEKLYLAGCFIFHCGKLKQQQQINLIPIQFPGNHKFSKNEETRQIIEVTRFEETFIGRQGELEV